jgi:hypothetical protein
VARSSFNKVLASSWTGSEAPPVGGVSVFGLRATISIISSVASGGIGGGIVMLIVGILKKALTRT